MTMIGSSAEAFARHYSTLYQDAMIARPDAGHEEWEREAFLQMMREAKERFAETVEA
jgi:hypothetical protein